MKLIQSIEEMQNLPSLNTPRVLVPTMGALHKGHSELIKKAREIASDKGIVIVSVFANPTQFDRQQDFDSYPKSLEKDLTVCETAGADFVFHPAANEMYHEERSISVNESALSRSLCGATRPGHFDGVCIVCTKFFNITKASHAVFGQKDFQQLAIIRRLVRDLNIAIKIIGAETVREPSGLAMSSRNLNLTSKNKEYAPSLFLSLNMAKQENAYGVNDSQTLKALVSNHLHSLPVEVKIDYLEIVDVETLAPVKNTQDNPSVIAIAAFFGDVRLIDNLPLS